MTMPIAPLQVCTLIPHTCRFAFQAMEGESSPCTACMSSPDAKRFISLNMRQDQIGRHPALRSHKQHLVPADLGPADRGSMSEYLHHSLHAMAAYPFSSPTVEERGPS